MIKEKFELFKQSLKKLISKEVDDEDNKNAQTILRKQIIRAASVAFCLVLILWLLNSAVNDANKSLDDKENASKAEESSSSRYIDLADKALDKEELWRNYFEEDLAKQETNTSKMVKALQESQEKLLIDVKVSLKKAVDEVHKSRISQDKQFEQATKRLKDSLEQQRLLAAAEVQQVSSVHIDEMGFENDVVFDDPKSIEDYIPEGTYFSGYLLNGLALSTGLNAPEENTTTVTIRLAGRGNLDKANKLKVTDCRITGSAYGDLSSERGVIRLEKMTCKANGVYTTSDIAGDVIGPDGLDGIKGAVISTSTKHLKNAAIGGVISGLVGASKGQEGFSLSAGGVSSSKSKGMGDLLRSGGINGVSNVGEKIADHYLRLADSLSPILTIDAGVKINPRITKGFFVGERGIRSKIKKDRRTGGGKK
jgi:hypothetical protein